jgi:hypothetical protein
MQDSKQVTVNEEDRTMTVRLPDNTLRTFSLDQTGSKTPATARHKRRPEWARHTDERGAHWSHKDITEGPAVMVLDCAQEPVVYVNSHPDDQLTLVETVALRDELTRLIHKAGAADERARLAELRKLAESQGRCISPNGTRDPQSAHYGRYLLSTDNRGAFDWVHFDRMTLDEVSDFLNRWPAGTVPAS